MPRFKDRFVYLKWSVNRVDYDNYLVEKLNLTGYKNLTAGADL